MWNEIYNNIFYNSCAIDEDIVDYLIEKIKGDISYEIKDDDYESIINKAFQLTTKYFNKNSSYGLHFENPTYFGDYFFVLYLDDCAGGELVFPNNNDIDILFHSKIESKDEWDKGVNHLRSHGYEPLIVDKTFSIQPKRNTAILGKIPYTHYVNKIQSENGRVVVNGFPFSK
jgi:hypothetical protein